MTDVKKNNFLTSDIRHPTSGAARALNSWDAIKLLALLLMFVDHSGHFYFTGEQWLRAIGRGAVPIFLFLGGFAASYRFKWDIFALALLMSVSDVLLTHHLRTQNILFTILLCRLIFAWLESKGRTIERPWEWYAGSLALIASIFAVQYGSFGMLFAISGYLARRSQYYPQALARRFLIASFIAYGIFSAFYAGFSPINTLLMSITLCAVYLLLSRLEIKNISAGPHWLSRFLKLISYYTGYIYALHLIALEWITGVPF